ncbi:MAG: lactonase family protein [Bacteriovoracia bacterium]
MAYRLPKIPLLALCLLAACSAKLTRPVKEHAYFYVLRYQTSSIDIFDLGRTDGSLRFVSSFSTADTCPTPSRIAASPDGGFLFLSNPNSPSTLAAYAITPGTGALTFVSSTEQSSGTASLLTSLDSRFLYVTSGGKISTFAINGGTLSQIGSPLTTPGGNLATLVAHPNGNFLYGESSGATGAYALQIDPTTGALTLLGGVAPMGAIRLHPDGNSAIASLSIVGLTHYSIELNSGLWSSTGSLGLTPSMFELDQSGRFLFAKTGSATLSVYRLQAGSGALDSATPIGTLTHASFGGPTAGVLYFTRAGNILVHRGGDGSELTTLGFDTSTGALSLTGASATISGSAAIPKAVLVETTEPIP